jgi:hypothetical protein
MDLTYGLGLTCALVALAAGGFAMVNQTIAMIAHRRWSSEHDRAAIWNSLQLYSWRRYREVAADADSSPDARRSSRAWRRAVLGSAIFIAMLPLMYLIVALR